MSGASDTLDPVEAAEDDIARSKHLIASTLDDLSRHHSWLESYHREERRRAQRLKRQETLRRLEHGRQRVVWRLWHLTRVSLAALGAAAALVARNAAALAAWAAPRGYALSRLLARWASAAASWSWRTGLSLGRTGFAAATAALAWMVRTSEALGIVFRRRLSAGFAVLSAKAAMLAQPFLDRAAIGRARVGQRWLRFVIMSRKRAAAGWSWVRTEAPALVRFLLRSAAIAGRSAGHAVHGIAIAGAGWTRTHAAQLLRTARRTALDLQSRAVKRAPVEACLGHRALILRPCTAIACVEAPRAGLPVVLPH